MKSHDKYAKVGSLHFALQKYEHSPNQKVSEHVQKMSEIPSEEIVAPPVRILERQSPKLQKTKSRSKEKRVQKSSVLKFVEDKSFTEPEEEESILQQCMNLSSKIELFKKQKYELAVQQYEEEERKKLEFLYEKHAKMVTQRYDENRRELKAIYDREASKILKSSEEINKYKDAYSNILDDLEDKRKKLNDEHSISIEKVRQSKNQLVGEWKKSSNEEIIKKCLKNI